MKGNETTTIAILQSTKEALEKLKIHPNQSYDELLREILKKLKKEKKEELNHGRI